MRALLIIALLIGPFSAFGQTAREFLQRGIAQYKYQMYDEAIAYYNKALEVDENFLEAYFHRGIAKAVSDDTKGALADFDKSLAIDESFPGGYYGRATIFYEKKKYKKALAELDKLIQLDDRFPNALTLRGQLRYDTGDKEGACDDFLLARQYGNAGADTYLSKLCMIKAEKEEFFMLDWPDEENWEVGSEQKNSQMMMLELVRRPETLDNWTEIGTMQTIPNISDVPMDKAMELMAQQARQTCPDVKVTFIEKDEQAKYPWILFKMECGSYAGNEGAESQLYYIVQGSTNLYVNFRAIKEPLITKETVDIWVEFFKKGKVVVK